MTDRGPDDATAPDSAEEDVIHAFIEYVNAKDWDGVAGLLSSNVELSLGGPIEAGEVISSLTELTLNHPGMLLTRGDRGTEPVAVAWIPDGEGKPWIQVGFFTFSLVDGSDHPLIEYLDYTDVPDDDNDLVAEEPALDEVSEWEDWNEWDEGAPTEEPGETGEFEIVTPGETAE